MLRKVGTQRASQLRKTSKEGGNGDEERQTEVIQKGEEFLESVLKKGPAPVNANRDQLSPAASGLSNGFTSSELSDDSFDPETIPEPDQERLPFLVFDPQNSWRIRWDLLASMFIVYSVVSVPYRIGFNREATGWVFKFDWFVDSIFFADIFISFRTAYWDGDELVTDQWLVARRYMATWFPIDILSTLPVDVIFSAFVSSASGTTSLRSLELVRIFRLVRLVKLVRLLKLAKFSGSIGSVFSINPALQRLIKLMCQIVFVAHLLACFWFFVSTWDLETNDTWVIHHNLANAGETTQYLASFYWTVTTMMAVGYGDIYAVNDRERLFSIFTQVVGATAFGFIIANISAFLETFDPRASAYRAKMDGLKEYLRERNLPKSLNRRVRKYYDYVLSKQSIFDDVNILSQLPQHMMEHIILHMHGKTAKQLSCLRHEESSFIAFVMARTNPLLATKGEIIAEEGTVGSHVYFLLSGKVESIIFDKIPENEDFPPVDNDPSTGPRKSIERDRSTTIRKRASNKFGGSSGSMNVFQFSHRSTEAPLKSKTVNETIMETYEPILVGFYNAGANFGEVAALKNVPHNVSFRANNTCDMIQVSKANLEYAIYLFPISAWRFRARCERHAELMDESLSTETQFFPEFARKAKARITFNGTKHAAPREVLPRLGKLGASNMVNPSPGVRQQSTKNSISSSATDVTASSNYSRNLGRNRKRENKDPVLIKVRWVYKSGNQLSFKIVRNKTINTELNSGPGIPKMWNAGPDEPAKTTRSKSKYQVAPIMEGTNEDSEVDPDNKDGNKATSAGAPRKKNPILLRSPSARPKTLKSGVMIEDTEATAEELFARMIIPPSHPHKTRWDIFIASLILYSTLIVPFRIGFSVPAVGWAKVFDWIVDILFFFDMIASFRTAYWHSDEEILVAVPSLIRSNYLRGWFTVDFLSTFPFDTVIAAILEGVHKDALRSLKLIRAVRMVRLLKLVRLFKLKKLMSAFEALELSPALMKLSGLFLQITFVAHIFGCFWFFIASQVEDTRDTWWFKLGYADDPELDITGKYIASLYWSFSTMTTVGYGDISPSTDTERVYAVVIMILGATVFGYVVGSIASLISMLDLGEALYKAKMNELEEYMREQGVPKSLRKECKACYAFSLSLSSVFDEKEILDQLSPSLRSEVLICIHEAAVATIPIFRNQRFTFISDMLRIMHPQLALPKSIIIREGDLGNQMYFIVSGDVTVTSKTTLSNLSNVSSNSVVSSSGASAASNPLKQQHDPSSMQPIAHRLYAGYMFGYEALLSLTKHKITAKANKATHLYVLSKTEIGQMVDTVPTLAVLLQTALRKAIRRQERKLGLHNTGTIAGVNPKKRWEILQSRFQDILSMSPSRMRVTMHDMDTKMSNVIAAMTSGMGKTGKNGAASKLIAKLKARANEEKGSSNPSQRDSAASLSGPLEIPLRRIPSIAYGDSRNNTALGLGAILEKNNDNNSEQQGREETSPPRHKLEKSFTMRSANHKLKRSTSDTCLQRTNSSTKVYDRINGGQADEVLELLQLF